MPPKRKPPTTSSPTTEKKPPPHRLALLKPNRLTISEENEIHTSFSLFSIPHPGQPKEEQKEESHVLPTSSLRKTLIALNTPPSSSRELREITSTLDPDGVGFVLYEHFVAVAALKLHSAGGASSTTTNEEIQKAFRLFTSSEGKEEITLKDLRRVARMLREEDISEEILRDMVREANGGGKGTEGVEVEAFADVMGRAGVFS